MKSIFNLLKLLVLTDRLVRFLKPAVKVLILALTLLTAVSVARPAVAALSAGRGGRRRN